MWLVSTGGGNSPVWSPAGPQLVYGAPDGRVMVADYTVEGNSFRPGKPRPWTDKPIVSLNFVNLSLGGGYTLAPDGKRLVVLPSPVTAGEPKGNLHVMMLVNFFDELRRRMPPGGK